MFDIASDLNDLKVLSSVLLQVAFLLSSREYFIHDHCLLSSTLDLTMKSRELESFPRRPRSCPQNKFDKVVHDKIEVQYVSLVRLVGDSLYTSLTN